MNVDSPTYEFMKAFRDDRLVKVDSGEIPVSLAEGPRTILHLLPASAFEPGAAVDLSLAARRPSLTGLHGENWGLSYDFEGLLVWESSASEDTSSYVQLFRTGAVEIADSALLSSGGTNGERPTIRDFERSVTEVAASWIGLLRDLSARGPLAVMLSLVGVRGWELDAGGTGDARLTARAIDRDELIVPEVFLEDLAGDLKRVLKFAFDPIWNAAGYPGSKSS